MYYSLSNFNFQLLVPTMSSEGVFISAFRLAVVPQRSPLSFCLLVGVFFLSHIFVECLIRGLTAIPFLAAAAALQQTQPANPTPAGTSRPPRAPSLARASSTLPCSPLLLLHACILTGSHVFREKKVLENHLVQCLPM